MTRTLLIQKWGFHTARVREAKRVHYLPGDVLGVDVLKFIEDHLSSGDSFDKKDKQRWVQVESVQRRGTRALLVTASAGAYGEPGRVVDRRDSTTHFELTPDHAAVAPTRMLVLVPGEGLNAFALMERSTGRGSAGLDVVGQLHSRWREDHGEATWTHEWIEDAQAWLEDAQLKAVEVQRYRGVADTFEGPKQAKFEYRARAPRGLFWPSSFLRSILDKAATAHELIGIEAKEEDRVFVDLILEGRSSKYAVDGGKLPRVQVVLPDSLSDDDFVSHCLGEIKQRLYPKLGLSYRPGWIE